MMRGGHLDYCVLGAFQVSANGDLANWHTGAPDAIPAVGGAMDLAIGAKQVFVMMEHLTKQGESKIVAQCSYPVTGVQCVSRIYTDLAVLDVTADGLAVSEIFTDLSFDELQKLTGVPLIDATQRPLPEPRACRRVRLRAGRHAWVNNRRTPFPQSDAMLEDSARLTSLICGTEPLNRIWSPRATIQRMLDVESALARALAAQQVIPPPRSHRSNARAMRAGSTPTRSRTARRSAAISRFRSSSSSPRK